jgi:hypothetical protein
MRIGLPSSIWVLRIVMSWRLGTSFTYGTFEVRLHVFICHCRHHGTASDSSFKPKASMSPDGTRHRTTDSKEVVLERHVIVSALDCLPRPGRFLGLLLPFDVITEYHCPTLSSQIFNLDSVTRVMMNISVAYAILQVS